MTEQPGYSPSDEQLVYAFLDALWMERGLSQNTLDAYRGDLLTLARWQACRGKELLGATRETLLTIST